MRKGRRKRFRIAALIVGTLTLLTTAGCRVFHASSEAGMPRAVPGVSSSTFDRSERRSLVAALDANLAKHVFEPWYSRALDTKRGGFHQTYAENWKELPDRSRSVVYQSRLTWVAAEALHRFPEQTPEWHARVRHGYFYLAGPMWDSEHGGWFWEIGADSKLPDARRGTEKHTYGIAFGIYASATTYRVTRDERALKLARDGFLWLDKAAHDATHGGYFEALSREGKPLLEPPLGSRAGDRDAIGTRYGLKSMNTHIHLLEAFTQLYDVWPDPTLRSRLEEVFRLVRDRVVSTNGYLHLFFKPDWTPVPDHDSFGHDIETAFLLTEAAYALGIPQNPETWAVARRLVDHALRFGWDGRHGGFYDTGIPEGRVTNTAKIWWTQAEGLNALLLMDQQFGSEDRRYRDLFRKQWEFIERFQTDNKHGGWHSEVAADGTPRPGQNKSNEWKDPYHQGRALMRCTDVLRQGL